MEPADPSRQRPPLDLVRSLLSLDASTGKLYWRVNRGHAKAGTEAGRVTSRGYREICVAQKFIGAHVVVWALVTGAWPEHPLDHKNRDKLCNVFDNLRPVTKRQNMFNTPSRAGSLSRFKGVSFHRRDKLWRARHGRRTVGYFKNEEDAARAYDKAALQDADAAYCVLNFEGVAT